MKALWKLITDYHWYRQRGYRVKAAWFMARNTL